VRFATTASTGVQRYANDFRRINVACIQRVL
jgi:hypothetical protein